MPVQTIAWIVGAGLLCLGSIRIARLLARYRGARLVSCPETRKTAGVELDTREVLTSGLVSTPRLQLSTCSRWPERAGCGQNCLKQVESEAEGCLVRTILADWFRNKECVFCHQPIGEIRWSAQKPALLTKTWGLADCAAIPVDRLPEALAEAKAVCFACQTATQWVREHPDLVVDRSMKTRAAADK